MGNAVSAAANAVCAKMFAERRIYVRTESETRYFRITPFAQFGAATLAACGMAWAVVATATLAVSSLEQRNQVDHVDALKISYEQRIETLAGEKTDLARQLEEAETRLAAAAQEMTQQQVRLVDAAETEQELSLALETVRAKLRSAIERRDAAELRRAALDQELSAVERRLASLESSETDLADTLETVTSALTEAVRTRDEAMIDTKMLTAELEAIERRVERNRERRERMLGQLEEAVQVSLGSLSGMFDKAGLDATAMVDEAREEYTGQGGPLLPAGEDFHGDHDHEHGAHLSGEEVEEASRVAALMSDLEQVNLMRIAAVRLPFDQPVKAAHRFTSGFGPRKDPKNGRHRNHNGVDFAGPRGTPILATADGVVSFSGAQRGFGNLIKIKHAYGYETYYAHLSKRHVKVGDRVARGQKIGDMGNTGRSTGTHLHYEIRRNGTPVNPLTYIEAARNVL